jgi:hypothetical protein
MLLSLTTAEDADKSVSVSSLSRAAIYPGGSNGPASCWNKLAQSEQCPVKWAQEGRDDTVSTFGHRVSNYDNFDLSIGVKEAK